ncbi:MAG: AAA-like domain-containing protein, partial [Bacillota bacterium]
MKEFNTTGVCIPEKHYMVNIREKLAKIEKMVAKGNYFTINKPRQYGKTTLLYLLDKRLFEKNYLSLVISFAGIGDEVFKSEAAFNKAFLKMIKKELKLKNEYNNMTLDYDQNELSNFTDLDDIIFNLIDSSDKDIVLMIDEVDKSSN